VGKKRGKEGWTDGEERNTKYCRAIRTSTRRDRGREGKREGGRTENAQGVDDVEGLRTAINLSDGQGAALGRTD